MRRLWKAVGCGRAVLCLLFAWFLLLLLLASPFFRAPESGGAAGGGSGAAGSGLGSGGGVQDERAVARRLARAFSDLEVLKKQNAELRSLFADIDLKDPSLQQEQKDALLQDLQDRLDKAEKLLEESSRKGDADVIKVMEGEGEPRAPSLEYEATRRRVADGVRELWYYFGSQLRQLKALASPRFKQMAERIDRVLKEGAEHKRALLMSVNQLAEVDGYAAWREMESLELSYLVQRRLHYLQNPPDCAAARKLLCNLNKGCGYGCQVHHVVYCLIVAYGTKRTLVLRSKGWRYHKAGWEEVFHPVSDTCPSDPSAAIASGSHAHWPGKPNTLVVELPIVDSLSPRPPYLPLAVPRDLAPRLARLHGDPIVWWVGQFLKFLLRPQPGIQKMLDSTARKLGFQRPIVGVHIRRTDKVGTEAAFHPLEEYMLAVEEWFTQLELERNALPIVGNLQEEDDRGGGWGPWVGGDSPKAGTVKRRVYLATDDPSVIIDAKAKYPSYEILGDPTIARTAAVSTRYSDSSLFGIIIDIHFLSLSDYLVCTFSSQVCRIAYEIMQQLRPDASDRFRSLDDIYYYGGQGAHLREAVLAHSPREGAPPGQDVELALEPGDLVGVAGNHWDGYSKGKSMRTGRVGLYPSFKVVDRIELADFPTYAEVPPKQRAASATKEDEKGGDEEEVHRRGAEAIVEET
ncbi:alpha-(1,6)-fucosyltransferase [Ischnura elegans]|uniref:alpha-(1,6)-fucosyltransferase n=1 Tax=Ischnura elegans TaxID=197161 RepID=UPI001ED8A1AB|nr:alpha-(1,6)-fucosyltransferase [Ischnura elegans]